MSSSAATATLVGRYAALRACADELSSEELLDVIELAQREKDAASARQAVALAHLAAREPRLLEDGTTAEVHHEIGHQRLDAPELAASRLGVSVHVATRRVEDAIRQLTRTPAVVDAMASGDLDEHRAAAVTEETGFLGRESAAEVVDRVQSLWRGLTVGPLRRLLARTAAQVDPDAVAAHAEKERARRGLTRRTGTQGTDHWRGDFRVEQSRVAWAAVTERARQRVREGSAENLEMARADAMMELILEHSDVRVVVHTTRSAGDDPATAASPTDDAAHTAVEGGADPAPRVPSSAAEDLVEVGGLDAPGTTFVPRAWLDSQEQASPADGDSDSDLTCDPDTGALLHGDVPASLASGRTRRSRSAPPDVPSPKYRIPAPTARLVRLRDGSCRFPGCAVPARQCDLDHVRAWPTGPTAPTNLMALCRRHHRIKQSLGWTVRIDPDATVTWRDPTDREITTRPTDHLHLVTAGHLRRDVDHTLVRLSTPEGPSTFEEAVIDLLGAPDRAHRWAHPESFDLDGTIIDGPPPRIDLDHSLQHGTGPWGQILIDAPPRRPPPPEPIPF